MSKQKAFSLCNVSTFQKKQKYFHNELETPRPFFWTGAHVIIFDLVHWRRQGLDQIISTINIKMSVLVKPHCTARQTRPCSNWNRRSRKKKLAKSGSQRRYAIMHVAERKLNYTRRIKKKKKSMDPVMPCTKGRNPFRGTIPHFLILKQSFKWQEISNGQFDWWTFIWLIQLNN